jgi:hypothetical protein
MNLILITYIINLTLIGLIISKLDKKMLEQTNIVCCLIINPKYIFWVSASDQLIKLLLKFKRIELNFNNK